MASRLFPDQAAALASFRTSLSIGVIGTYLSGVTALADDTYLWGKLTAAEADASRRLRVLFGPTEIIPDDALQSEVDALVAAGTPFLQEGAYDYDPGEFGLGTFPMVNVLQRPLIAVRSIKLSYPGQMPGLTAWEFPSDWIRLNRKYGQISLVPTATGYQPAPVAMFTLSTLTSGGMVAPCVIQVRYLAGLADPANDYPDLIDTVKKMAILRVLEDAMLPQSGSISADGLSQTTTIDMDKFHDSIEDKLNALREAIHGVRMIVL
jgi:hypothetical protein